MKKYIFIFTIFSFVFSLNAQEERLKKADKLFFRAQYERAIPKLEKEIERKATAPRVKRLADAYYFTSQMEAANQWYKTLLTTYKSEADAQSMFRYAQTLKAMGNYEEANKWSKSYLDAINDAARISAFDENVAYLDDVTAMGERYEMVNLGINTEYSEFGAVPFGRSIVFASSRERDGLFQKIYSWNRQPYLDLYVIEMTERFGTDDITSSFSDDLNTAEVHESNAVFSKDAKTVYFTRNNFQDGKKVRDDERITHLQIFKAVFDDKYKEWSNIEPLSINADTYSVMHPALSPDERTLYFSSDMPGGAGDYDLYSVAINADGSLGEPQNLGPEINTDQREQFPFVSANGTLYFSSNGHPGFGSLDVFASKVENGGFGKPDNIGLPVNSGFDDFAFYIDDRTTEGYVASNRPGGKGDDDIYAIKELKPLKIEKCKQYIEGLVTDSYDNTVLGGATVIAFDIDGKEIQRVSTASNGTYKLILPCDQIVKVSADMENYLKSESTVTLDKERDKVNTLNFSLESLIKRDDDIVQVDEKIILKVDPIYFAFDKWDIRPAAAKILDGIVDKFAQYPNMKIEIGSHTDQRGPDEYNDMLSSKRANSTRDYLISKGVPEGSITAKGYGETQPVVVCGDDKRCTEKEHDLNRRSEFVIKSIE